MVNDLNQLEIGGSPTHQNSQPEAESNQGTCEIQFTGSSAPSEIEYNSEGDEILSKHNLRSVSWQNFQKIKMQDGTIKARCLYCNKKLGAKAKNGTTHLADHSKTCLKKKMVDSKQKFLTPAFVSGEGKKASVQTYNFDSEVSRKQLAYMIIIHEYPLSIVGHVEFRKFCHSLQPGFKVVSRTTIKRDIIKIYDVEKLKTMRIMERVKSRISFTTDMWTSKNQKRGFMVITAHFIDDEWKLQHCIIRFAYVPCPHTAERLCEVLMDTFLEWNVDSKLYTLTVDNCTTNDAMIDLLFDKFGADQIWCKGLYKFGDDGNNKWCKNFFHIRCGAHILNLIVKEGLDVLKGSIENVRDSVAYWTATPKREEKFEEATKQLGITCGKSLGLDCSTRWNSTYLMLETAIPYKSVFYRLKLKESHYTCCPTEDDWNLAEDMVVRLAIFYKATLLFSGTTYPTANVFFRSVCDIMLALREWSMCGNVVVEKMAEKMIAKYTKYWDGSHGFLAVAVVLDPQFKLTLIKYYYIKLYGEARGTEMTEKVKSYCCDLLELYTGKIKKKNYAESSSSSKDMNSYDFVDDYELFLNQEKKGKTSHVKSELDYYLDEEQLPRYDGFDLLAWWKTNGIKYHTLQAIARDVLAVPVSTVASESAFSTSGRILNDRRNRLAPKTLEALMCSQSWLTSSMKEGIPPTMDDEESDSDSDITDIE